MQIQSMDDFNSLQQRVLRGENVSREDIREAVRWVRHFRKTELPARTAKGAKAPPRDLDVVMKDLGFGE